MAEEVEPGPVPVATLAALCGQVLAAGKRLLLLVPDDDPLPALSTALDPDLRPLCLVLPSADFAARIAVRATLALLRSRLARGDDAGNAAAWQTQRRRIAAADPAWQAALTWGAGNDRSPWPRDVTGLFPVRILPVAAYREQPVRDSDLVVFYHCDLGLETATLPGRHLHVGHRWAASPGRTLAPSDESSRLQMELAQLTQDVGELELELATAQGELAEFTHRYYEQVGLRMTELDALRARATACQARRSPHDLTAAAAAAAAQAESERSAAEQRRFERHRQRQESPPPGASTGFRPDADVKRLFRQIAQKIHPDRAADENDRAWRTQLMSEANRAYRAADLDGLREVAALWEEGAPPAASAPAGVGSTGSAAPPSGLRGQVQRMRRRLQDIQDELHRLFGSKLYELLAAARQAWRQGRDLLQEMADSIESQIVALRLQLGLGQDSPTAVMP